MTEIEIKEHYIFKMLLQAAKDQDDIVITHKDFYPFKIHITDNVSVSAKPEKSDCVKLSIADLEQLVGCPVAIVTSRSNATHVLTLSDTQ